MTEIGQWLERLELAKYADAFAAAEIDLAVLPELTEADLEKLGIPLGPRKKLLRAIADLAATPEAPPQKPGPTAERRQLTVLFADLADSTALSRALDPEELREVMRGYQTAVSATIREAGGFLAKYLGDGVLAYFGYPQAREDAAERAVQAGLAAVVAVKALPPVKGFTLAARVGIATGPVVVGDVVGEDIAREVNVVGETPNLAARLLALGEPGSVLIAESTRRLIGDLFRVESLGAREFKGFAEPITAFAVRDERQGMSRFEAARAARQTRFVGRGQEVGLLLDRWEHAKAAEGQLVLLSGEAGIGKSRITETFHDRIANESYLRIRYQCSPQHLYSPLYPVAAQLAHAAHIEMSDDDPAKREKLRLLLNEPDTDRLTLIASVLGVPLPAQSDLAQMAAPMRRQRTLAALADALEALSGRQPVLWLVEDAHWIDPTTQELVGTIIERLPRLKLLIVVTFRPEYRAPWAADSSATQLALNRLTRAQISTLLEGLAAGRKLPVELIEHIVAKSDGIPLYIEEMFRGLCDSGVLVAGESEFTLAHSLESRAVPATLQDALMARLDRLAPAKAVAQIGAVIGREFNHRLLSEVVGMEPTALHQGLTDLISAGLLFARGAPPYTSYVRQDVAVPGQASPYGRKYEVSGRLVGPSGRAGFSRLSGL